MEIMLCGIEMEENNVQKSVFCFLMGKYLNRKHWKDEGQWFLSKLATKLIGTVSSLVYSYRAIMRRPRLAPPGGNRRELHKFKAFEQRTG